MKINLPEWKIYSNVQNMNTWKTKIEDLLQRGETLTTIARAVGITSANVRMLMRNERQQPSWPTGEKILALHRRVMKKYPKVNTSA